MSRIRPPVKTHGGKYYLAPWVIENFPTGYENLTYVEVFVGGGSVLLHKEYSEQEIIADKDRKIIALWKSLRYDTEEMIIALREWPYTLESFEKAQDLLKHDKKEMNDFDTAVAEFIVRRMSRGGLRKKFAWSERLRGGKPGDLNAWETSLDNLWTVAERAQQVEMWCLDFRDVLKNWDDRNVLFYLDPPYLKSTRAKGSTEAYEFEMNDQDHTDMLNLCLASKAKIVISGYPSPLYMDKLTDWKLIYKNVANHSSQTKTKKVKKECLWMNY
jgi:DNA adenine methylase